MSMIPVISILLFCQLQMLSVCGQQQFTLEILADSYQHNQHMSGCCRPNCLVSCTYSFTFCVERTIDMSGSCTLGQYQFQAPSTTSATVTFNMDGQIVDGQDVTVTNPMLFTSSGPWPGEFRLTITANADGDNNPAVTILDRRTLSAPDKIPFTTTMISVNYNLYCNANYYGPNCEVECTPRDDNQGHYTCDPTTGDRVCLKGFTNPDTGCVDTIDSTQPTTSTTQPTEPPTTNEPATTTVEQTTAATTEATTTPVVTTSEPCPDMPCLNGGICDNRGSNTACICDDTGYQGDYCEIPISTAPPVNTATMPSQATDSPTTTESSTTTDSQIVGGGDTQANQLSEGGVAGLVIGLMLLVVLLMVVGVSVAIIVWRNRTNDTYKLDPVKAKQSLDNPNYETVELRGNSPQSGSSPANVYAASANFNQALEHVLDNDNPLYFSTASGDYILPPDNAPAQEESDYDLPHDEQGYPLPPSQPPPRAPHSELFDNPDYEEI